jgi:alkylhydroperoxidase family enzyme
MYGPERLLIRQEHVSDAVYEQVTQNCTGEELVNLTLAVITINGWNRLAIAFRAVPGQISSRARCRSQIVNYPLG